jgi:hypothetical protein
MRTLPGRLLPLLATLVLAACAASPTKQALNDAAIAKVQADIKRQVGVYIAATKDLKSGDPSEFWCGRGNVNFDISHVKAELTVTTEQINSVSIKAKLPFKAIEVDPSGSTKKDVTNTQVLDYNLWPLDVAQQVELPNGDVDSAPIAKVLLALRKALIDSAKRTSPGPQACFTDYSPDKASADAGNTFKLGLSFVNDSTGGFELKVWVLDLSATTETKGTTGNTLTVFFVQHGLKDIQILQDEASAQCKFPDYDKPMCALAITALHLITDPTSKVAPDMEALETELKAVCTPAKAGDPPPKDCKGAKMLATKALQLLGQGVGLEIFDQ